MEIFANITSGKLKAAQYPSAKRMLGWLRRWRDIAPRLIVAVVLLSLGQLAGRTDYHPVEGVMNASSAGDIEDLPIATASVAPFAPSAPTNSQHLPQPHIWHHAHCEFAPSLTTVLLIPPVLIVLRCFLSSLRLQQITIIPITPPATARI